MEKGRLKHTNKQPSFLLDA